MTRILSPCCDLLESGFELRVKSRKIVAGRDLGKRGLLTHPHKNQEVVHGQILPYGGNNCRIGSADAVGDSIARFAR